MKPLRWSLAAVLVAALGCVIGCDKKVNLTFVNTTPESLAIALSVPGQGTQDIGVAGPSGGKLRHEVNFSKDDLPATCQWRADGQGGQFTITQRMDKKQFIYIESTGHVGPVDKKTEIQKEHQTEIKDVIVHQEEVVE